MRDSTRQDYARRLTAVLRHIQDRLDADPYLPPGGRRHTGNKGNSMETTEVRKEKVFLRGRGGSDAAHRADEALYHELLVRHGELERITRQTGDGIESVTRVTSGDPGLVKILQDHAVGMKKRYDGGRAVRSWDPLFVELFDHRDAIKIRWKMLDDGISVSLTSDRPEIRDLILRHDETLQAFIAHGFEAAKHESPYRPDGGDAPQ